jgi:hypothetical protein
LQVFISYRRSDSIDIAGRIFDHLAGELGSENVFFDIDRIPFGVDFRQHIERVVSSCDVVLVVIGQGWADASDDHGRRRLDEPDDLVRLEVEAALQRDIPVVPVLVDGAAVPAPDKLPVSLAELTYRNATQVRHDPDFHADVDRLVRGLAAAASSPAAADASPPVPTGSAPDSSPSATTKPVSERPAVPATYLASSIDSLRTRAESPNAQSRAEQVLLLADLKALVEEVDAATGEQLLHAVQQRPDLTVQVANEIAAMLSARAESSTGTTSPEDPHRFEWIGGLPPVPGPINRD